MTVTITIPRITIAPKNITDNSGLIYIVIIVANMSINGALTRSLKII